MLLFEGLGIEQWLPVRVWNTIKILEVVIHESNILLDIVLLWAVVMEFIIA